MKKTLIVLGAGASKSILDFFPTGIELIINMNYHLTIEETTPPPQAGYGKYLSSMTNTLLDVLGSNYFKHIATFKTQLWQPVLDYQFRYPRDYEVTPPLIDALISQKIKAKELPDEAKNIAKFIIAYLIIGSEHALKDNMTKKFDDENWINVLFQKLKSFQFDTILENLQIVTFNYDRVFEHYSLKLIDKYFNQASIEQKDRFVSQVKHIYGSLGKLTDVGFGNRNDDIPKMKNAYKKFNLLYEERNILDGLENSFEQIYFLGFGYDETNLSNLGLKGFTNATHKIGTGLKFDEKVKENLSNTYGIKIEDLNCLSFCEKYLSF